MESDVEEGTNAGWIAFVDNRQAIDSLYHAPPDLADVILCSVALGESGWACRLTVATRELPHRSPKKWANGYDTVYINFGIAELVSISLNGWPRDRKGRLVRLSATRSNGGLNLAIVGSGASLYLKAPGLHICGIEGRVTGDDCFGNPSWPPG